VVYVDFIIFVASLFLLLKGSDYLVESAAILAKAFNISEFAIGLSLVAIGTSLPELATSIAAVLAKDTNIVIGNIIGSNIANIGLVLGIAAIFATLTIDKKIFFKEGIFLLVMSILVLIFSLDRTIGLIEGIVLLFFFLVFIINLVKDGIPKEKIWESRDITAKQSLFYILISIISMGAIVLSARYLVESSINIASFFNISSTFIGLTMIAVGTSLPELAVTVIAIKKGYGNLLLGNLIGSNIVNLLLILGISSVLAPIAISRLEIFYTIPFMIILTLFLLKFIRSSSFVKIFEGIILLFLYLIFIFSLVFFL